MTSIYFHSARLSGCTTTMLKLVPMEAEEKHPLLSTRPSMSYWKRLHRGIPMSFGTTHTSVSISTFRKGNLSVDSIVEFVNNAPNQELRDSASMALDGIKKADGIVILSRSDDLEFFRYHFENIEANFSLLGRNVHDIPLVVQATFQDDEDAFHPSEIASELGLEEKFCFASCPPKGQNVREPLAKLIEMIGIKLGYFVLQSDRVNGAEMTTGAQVPILFLDAAQDPRCPLRSGLSRCRWVTVRSWAS